MKSVLFALSLLSLSFLSSSWSHGAESRQHLFFITRGKNGNIVQYDISRGESGNPTREPMVVAYWILESGEERGLTWIQKKLAYGIVSQKKLDEETYEIALAAFKDRKITVRRIAGGYQAIAIINGRQAVLERIHVESTESILGLPRVLYVDLYGRDCDTDEPVRDRLQPT